MLQCVYQLVANFVFWLFGAQQEVYSGLFLLKTAPVYVLNKVDESSESEL